jgi:hypothetical protein
VALAISSCAVQATPFTAYIHRLYIERNGNVFFDDTFSDNNPPPSVPIPPNTGFTGYGVQGSFLGGESGGKLRIGGNGYTNTNNALGEPRLVNSVTLLTNTDSTNTTNGLKRNFGFDIFGMFDFVTPGDFDSYGIRLTDGGHDDVVDFRVAWSSVLHAPVLKYFAQNFDLHTLTNLAEVPLPSSGFDQVVLAFSHPINTDQIQAGYLLVSGGNTSGQFTVLGPTATIFHGELWTRADFRAVRFPNQPPSLSSATV